MDAVLRACDDDDEGAGIKALCLLKLTAELSPKQSQLFLKWWLATYTDAGIHSIAWKNRSGAQHHFFFFFFFDSQTFVGEEKWVTAASNQASGPKSRQHQGGEKKKKQFFFLRRSTSCMYWTSPGCFLRSSWAAASSPPAVRRLETADESRGRVALRTPTCESHNPCEPLLPGGWAVDAQPSSFRKEKKEKKNPILAKVEIGQVESIAYFMLP